VSSHSDLKLTRSPEQAEKKNCANAFTQTAVSQSFGLLLYTLRERLGVTQRDAASRCAISRAYYGELENSKRPPPPDKRVIRLGVALGATTRELESLCAVARSERLTKRDLPTDRSDLQDLVQRILLYGPSLHPALVDDLLRRVAESRNPVTDAAISAGSSGCHEHAINRSGSQSTSAPQDAPDFLPTLSRARSVRIS
jgi:transcriptional regulator with XRE-family HTH domain